MNSNYPGNPGPCTDKSESTGNDSNPPLRITPFSDSLPIPAVDRDIAKLATRGTVFYHRTERNRDGSAVRVRVTGMVKLWKRSPHAYRLPVKYGLRQSFYIHHNNSAVWLVSDPTAIKSEGRG